MNIIEVTNLTGGYNVPILKGLQLEIHKGEFFALLGQNGSGKTTLFKLITGQLPVTEGEIWISNKNLFEMTKLEKAKKMAVLTQEIEVSFDYTVEEIISLGRYPHQTGFIKQLSKRDRQVIESAMQLTDTCQFRSKTFRVLSGGEKQRVLLAKALAQEPEILLLDEPTNHLDLKHTLQLLDLLKARQYETGLTIFAILHDVNVASLYADRIGLLQDGKLLQVGDATILKDSNILQEVFDIELKQQSHPTIAKPQLLLTPNLTQEMPKESFDNSYQMTKTEEYIHVHFNKPLRTISNSVIGEGLNWSKHFVNVRVDKQYNSATPVEDLTNLLSSNAIPTKHTCGLMTAVNLEDAVMLSYNDLGIPIFVVVTAGTGNAVDITAQIDTEENRTIGTINTMLFIDAHLTDGALINAMMSVTEAKVKVLNELQIIDPVTKTIATGTSTDAIIIGVTQRGEAKLYAGSGTTIGKSIGQAVYQATFKSLENYLLRLNEKA
ncbi:adenosylcobinamide amidohydrolase [Metabacillus malikii]|uniref:Iron complex transport system ATP-binding protein n=1 Tax=Metabacillus malikii TaxID=1504265 RepID=A0ABT9Z9R8_9BACI|nr:adenosylcobinamide amidohydrolase [Metabacillus malikii]MDQ0228987.1 iron complex transport system ATP-binding protein [Metabacillus malikii]